VRQIRRIADPDRARLADVLIQSWGSTRMDTRGRLVDVLALPGFVAEDDGQWLGYLCHEIRGTDIEVIALEALLAGQGVGSALLAECVTVARDANARRLWLLTSNDNVGALRYYQRRGFVLVAVHRDAITHARNTLKPELPLLGRDDIPLRDEIELELPPTGWDDFVVRNSWPS
jgi:GNAT superfamily N-acetyltransferase